MLYEENKENTQETQKREDQPKDFPIREYFEQDSLEITDNVKVDAPASTFVQQLEFHPELDNEKQQQEQLLPIEPNQQDKEVSNIVDEFREPLQEKNENLVDKPALNESTYELSTSIEQKPKESTPENQDQNDHPEDSPKFTAISTKNHDAYQTFQTAAGNSVLFESDRPLDQSARSDAMEFSKNYPDDLLMAINEDGQQGALASADLADFELPPCSGSSSGSSEPGIQQTKQPSPAKRKSSTSSSGKTSLGQASSTSQAQSRALGFKALQKLLVSSYNHISKIVHWNKPIETGIVFAIGATLITALTFLSIISVVAYSALGVIVASGLIRTYKTVMGMLNKSPELPIDYVWDRVLSVDVSLPADRLHELVDSSSTNLNALLAYFKQVLLVEDKFATLKVAIFLYLLTYIGAIFNGMTLITLGYLALFTLPKVYEKNSAMIDEYVGMATKQLSSATSLITSKLSSVIGTSTSSSPAAAGSLKKQN